MTDRRTEYNKKYYQTHRANLLQRAKDRQRKLYHNNQEFRERVKRESLEYYYKNRNKYNERRRQHYRNHKKERLENSNIRIDIPTRDLASNDNLSNCVIHVRRDALLLE